MGVLQRCRDSMLILCLDSSTCLYPVRRYAGTHNTTLHELLNDESIAGVNCRALLSVSLGYHSSEY